MSDREHQRLADIQAAIDAIRSHLPRGDLSDGLIFAPSASACWRSAKRLKHCRTTCWPTQPSIPWRQITRMRDHLAHPYFDTAHSISQATVDEDLPDLERAVQALARSLEENDPGPAARHDLTQRH